MSYYVHLEIAWDGRGPDPFTVKGRREVFSYVEAYLRNEEAEGRDGRFDWLDEFRTAFSGKGHASIKYLEQKWTADLLAYVSARFPGAGFWARGIGEDFTDVWVVEVSDGQVEWAASLEGERRGAPRMADTMPPWPEPLEASRIVVETSLIHLLRETLGGEPPAAEVGALVLKRKGERRPRALVYVGPLSWGAYERVRDSAQAASYGSQLYRDARSLMSYPVATAQQPRGY